MTHLLAASVPHYEVVGVPGTTHAFTRQHDCMCVVPGTLCSTYRKIRVARIATIGVKSVASAKKVAGKQSTDVYEELVAQVLARLWGLPAHSCLHPSSKNVCLLP